MVVTMWRLLSVMLCSLLMSFGMASEKEGAIPGSHESFGLTWVEEFRLCVQGFEDTGMDRTEARQQCVALTLQPNLSAPGNTPADSHRSFGLTWVVEYRLCVQGFEDTGMDRTEARQQCSATLVEVR